MELLQERAYETITVKDITHRANIGRSTFYAHFEDKEQLLFSGHASFTDSLTKHVKSIAPTDSYSLLKMIFSHVQSYHFLAKDRAQQDEVMHLMLKKVKEIFVIHFQSKAKQQIVHPQKINLFAEAFASAMVGLIQQWSKEENLAIAFMVEKGNQILDAFLRMAKDKA